jgi:SpoVK/Ycf46/Vps4 family AAA+-type ATPase
MNLKDNLKLSIISRNQVVYIVSWEQDRAEKIVDNLFESLFSDIEILNYQIGKGLINSKGDIITDTDDSAEILKFYQNHEKKSVLILKDFHLYWKDPTIIRLTKETLVNLKGKMKYIVFISTILDIPVELIRDIEVLDLPLPNKDDIRKFLSQIMETYKKKGTSFKLSDKDIDEIVIGLQGMTLSEIHKSLIKLLYNKKEIEKSIIDDIHKLKKQIIKKESVLEYVDNKIDLNNIGGLEYLKEWLIKRKDAFLSNAREYGLDKPRGVLIMGITGCGKSLSIKAIPKLWNIPMFRLDMNLVYSGIGGEPEIAFNRSLKLVESLAPAVLWLDEIESGITDKQTEGATSRILGFFLTWMQEHKADVFVAATANRIDRLPAEVLRRGRFDQIFFVDLPTWKEREDIFKVHLLRRKNNLNEFNIQQLAQITKGWSGAEIEQVIISASYEAYAEKRKLTEDDLFKIFGNTVPLSTTMSEQIKNIRSWAHDRAIRASKEIPEV